MTVDTAAEGNVDWPLAYQHLWDRYLALGEALEAEREKVRVLTRIGARIVESEVSRRPGLRSLAIEELRAALAAAGGEGATP